MKNKMADRCSDNTIAAVWIWGNIGGEQVKKIKQINADTYHNLDKPLNAFLQTLPQAGKEIIKITYLTAQNGIPESAMIEYEIDWSREKNI